MQDLRHRAAILGYRLGQVNKCVGWVSDGFGWVTDGFRGVAIGDFSHRYTWALGVFGRPQGRQNLNP
jgi:hypothetical protein